MLDLSPTETVDEWISQHSEIDARLIQSVVDDVERIALEVEEKFRIDLVVHAGRPEIESAGYSDEFIEYMGLDDREWALEYIFATYLPNLHRRSGLMVMFAHFEGRLEKLCNLYQTELRLDSSYKQCKGRGILKYFRYLRTIVGLPIETDSDVLSKIYQIRDIRNLVAHCQADLSRTSEENKIRILNIVQSSPELTEQGELIMFPGYLGSVVNTISRMYLEIKEAELKRRERIFVGSQPAKPTNCD